MGHSDIYMFLDELKRLMNRYGVQSIDANTLGQIGLTFGQTSGQMFNLNKSEKEEIYTSFHKSIDQSTSPTDFFKL